MDQELLQKIQDIREGAFRASRDTRADSTYRQYWLGYARACDLIEHILSTNNN